MFRALASAFAREVVSESRPRRRRKKLGSIRIKVSHEWSEDASCAVQITAGSEQFELESRGIERPTEGRDDWTSLIDIYDPA